MPLTKLADFSFVQQSEFEFINFKPEAIAMAIEQLGEAYAQANCEYERAKDYAEYVLNKLTVEYKGDRGSVSGARIQAESDDRYQQTLSDRRNAECLKIEAQASFKAAENYAKMSITKVSAESKIADHYQKRGGLT